MANKAFSIFADERNDHSKMVKQLLADEVPPIAKAKPQRPASAHPTAAAAKPPKHKTSKAPTQTSFREEISKTSRFVTLNVFSTLQRSSDHNS